MSDDVNLPTIGAVIHTDEIGGRHYQVIKLAIGNDNTDDGLISNTNPLPSVVNNALVTAPHDYVGLTYDDLGKVTTAVYKTGGASGTTVATLSLTYSGNRLASITRS